MISQELIYDEDFNSLSLGAQALFLRMLAVSDDCGVVPANEYTLRTLTNPPKEIQKRLTTLLKEIVGRGLGYLFQHNSRDFFTFKPSSFDRINKYIIAKRTKSEYLNITHKEFEALCESFPEILGNSREIEKTETTSIERIKNKDKSIKHKDTVSDEFESLWSEYPRREGKKEARKHFDATVHSDEDLGRIRSALNAYKAHIRKEHIERKFTKMGSTWFNQWEDWIPDVTKKKVVDAPRYLCPECGETHAHEENCPKLMSEASDVDPDIRKIFEGMRA